MIFRRSHHDNICIRGCLEECIVTARHQMTALKQLDPLDLVIGVIERVQLTCNRPILREPALVKAFECQSYIDTNTNREDRLDLLN
ncbi:phosphoketolase family protein [Coraliomargarita sp. W4R53]